MQADRQFAAGFLFDLLDDRVQAFDGRNRGYGIVDVEIPFFGRPGADRSANANIAAVARQMTLPLAPDIVFAPFSLFFPYPLSPRGRQAPVKTCSHARRH
jgi:hypothetical protein